MYVHTEYMLYTEELRSGEKISGRSIKSGLNIVANRESYHWFTHQVHARAGSFHWLGDGAGWRQGTNPDGGWCVFFSKKTSVDQSGSIIRHGRVIFMTIYISLFLAIRCTRYTRVFLSVFFLFLGLHRRVT